MVRRLAPHAWAVALAVLMLGPALGAGYLLTYDMVWVPDLALRGDFLGLGTALPRAVPSDAVVAILDEVVPGMLLQKAVLLGALVLGGLGAARLAGSSTLARLVAVSVYVWCPFVVERLWIGHWPVLLCWAVLPWLVLAGVRLRADPRLGPALPWLLLVGSLSANAGLMSAAVLIAVGLTRRSAVRLAAVVLAVNAPWAIAGLLHVGDATTAATTAFGLNHEGPVPAPLAALTLGGVWNSEVVPGSREVLVLSLFGAALLLLAAVTGLAPLRERLGRRTTSALVALWVAGYGLALLSWAAPGVVGAIAGHVPGGGLLRDGARFLALCAPLVAALAAAAATRLAGWLATRVPARPARTLVAVAGALVPLALMPDAAWGVSGTWQPATYPDDYAAARAVLADDPPDGDLLVLPFTAFRAPTWNHGRTVLDPLPRYLQPDYVVDDRLPVDGAMIAGEDPRGPRVLAALALPDAEARAAALAALGIAMVARERDTPSEPEYDGEVAGTTVYSGPRLELVALTAPVASRAADPARTTVLVVAWSCYLAVIATGLWNVLQMVSRRNRRNWGSG